MNEWGGRELGLGAVDNVISIFSPSSAASTSSSPSPSPLPLFSSVRSHSLPLLVLSALDASLIGRSSLPSCYPTSTCVRTLSGSSHQPADFSPVFDYPARVTGASVDECIFPSWHSVAQCRG